MTSRIAELPGDPHDQACAWIARLRAEDAGSADHRAFARWLEADRDHAAAYDSMLELWCDLGVLRVLPLDVPEPAGRQGTRTRWHVPLALAASLTAVLLLLPRSVTQPPLELRTPVGGFDQVRLEDGSELTLNTDTSLEIRMQRDERVAHMRRGEAFFRIAPDADRPFTAVCGTSAVTVLGTAFNASCRDEVMSVLVEEGVVRFGAWPATGNGLLMRAGDLSRSGSPGGVESLPASDAEAQLAWRNRQLVFDGAALDTVIRELQRYMKPTLRIVDADAAGLRVSGVFSTSEPHLTLRALERSLGLRIDGPEQGPLQISQRSD